jgi:hypothetical protein
MDHVPMHSTPYHPPLLVPYLADGNSDLAYDSKGLLTFPERKGINPDALIRGDFQNWTKGDILCFFQSWCFFGLLIEVLQDIGMRVTVEDFVRREADKAGCHGKALVSTDNLPWLIREWESGARQLTENQKVDRFASIYKNLREVAQFVYLAGAFATDADGRHFFSDETERWEDVASVGNVVQLSIMILWEYLGSAVIMFYKPKAAIYDIAMGQSAYLKTRMLQAGWCPHEIKSLNDQLIGVVCLYYLSSLNRHSLGRNHQACETSSRCVYEKLNLDTYSTKHSAECPSMSLS